MTKTVNFDTAVCTNETMRELNDKQLALTYSIYSVMESKLWYFAHKHDAFDDPNFKARRQQVFDAMDIIRAAYIASYPEKCFMWYFGGSTTSELLTYKGIEKAVAEEFGTEGICLMSDRDGVRIEVSDMKKEALEKFLKELDPDLELWMEPIDKDEIGQPINGGWDVAEDIVKKAGIKVEIAMPELTPKSSEVLDGYMKAATEALEKTGLSPADAIAKLADRMGVETYG